MKSTKKPPRAGLVKQGPAPVKLDAAGKRAVALVISALEEWVDEFEDGQRRVMDLLLTEVFEGDAKAMLGANRATHPRWVSLLEQAEGRVSLSNRVLSVMARLRAYDELVTGRHWKRVPMKVRERLLILADPADPAGPTTLSRLKEAARHCLVEGLDAQGATLWAQQVLRESGLSPRRNAGPKTYDRQLDRTLDLFGTPDGVARLVHVLGRLDEEEREELRAKLARAVEQLGAVMTRLKKL